MPTALQLGQRQLPLQQILQYLTTSPVISQYLRLVIIEETLIRWQQSPEYQAIDSACKSISTPGGYANNLDLLVDPFTPSPPEDPHQLRTANRSQILQKYQQLQWGHRIASYFLARKEQLDRAIFSVIQVDNIGMAQEIYLRVKDRRQSFDKLARLYSQGAQAKLGGVVGPILIGDVHPHIANYLISLEPGELSPLFQIDNFYVFIRLEQRLPAKFDDEMKEQLMEELFEQWLQREISNRISHLHVASLQPNEPILTETVSTDTLPAASDQFAKEVWDTHIPLPDLDPPPTAVAPIQAGVSFFPPTITEVVEHHDVVTSSFFLPQSTPTQLIDRQQQRHRQATFQQFLAFCLFFSLFLGGGLGTVYLLNFLTGNPGMQTGQRE